MFSTRIVSLFCALAILFSGTATFADPLDRELAQIKWRSTFPSLIEVLHPEYWSTYTWILWPMLNLVGFEHGVIKQAHLVTDLVLTPFVTHGVGSFAQWIIAGQESARRRRTAEDIVALLRRLREGPPLSNSQTRALEKFLLEIGPKLVHRGDLALDRRALPRLREIGKLAGELGGLVDAVDHFERLFAGAVDKDMPQASAARGGIIGLAEKSADEYIARQRAKEAPPKPPEPVEKPQPPEMKLGARAQDPATPNRTAIRTRGDVIELELPRPLYHEFLRADEAGRRTIYERVLAQTGVWLHSGENPDYYRFIPQDDIHDIPGARETTFTLFARPVGPDRKVVMNVTQGTADVTTAEVIRSACRAMRKL